MYTEELTRMDMPDSDRRLFNFEPDSSPYEMYIEEVDREIDDHGAKFRKKLAVLAGITEGELRNLLKSYTTAEIEAAIAERDAREAQTGQAGPDKPEEPSNFGGWSYEREQAEDRREAEREADLRRSKSG